MNQYENVELLGIVPMRKMGPTLFRAFPPGNLPSSHRNGREKPEILTGGGEWQPLLKSHRPFFSLQNKGFNLQKYVCFQRPLHPAPASKSHLGEKSLNLQGSSPQRH